MKDRLVWEDGEPPKKSFYDPMNRASKKTMSEFNKSTRVNAKKVAIYLRPVDHQLPEACLFVCGISLTVGQYKKTIFVGDSNARYSPRY